MDHDFPAARFCMRVRRIADLSQRDLASRLGITQSQVSKLETSQVAPDVGLFHQLLRLAGLRLAVVDAEGNEVAPTPPDPIRDNGGRRFPVHLDVANRQPWWRYNHPHYHRDRPVAPFLMRRLRDEQRAADGVEADQLTATELWAERSAAAAERAARLAADRRARMRAAEPVPDCECELECHESGPCVPDCSCQCEPMRRRPRQVG